MRHSVGVRRERALEVSIHAPWEGCDWGYSLFQFYLDVSIHAPWEGCDIAAIIALGVYFWFQFTHPGKGATYVTLMASIKNKVSIHAPWEGCDQMRESRAHLIASFNSRTLGRVRQSWEFPHTSGDAFQFTHPGKGATV